MYLKDCSRYPATTTTSTPPPPPPLHGHALSNRLYSRTFGATNHEVVTTADNQLQTIRPIQGRFYRFHLADQAAGSCSDSKDAQLVITEVDATQPRFGALDLELLDAGPDSACGAWGAELPVHLRELYSHWLDRWGRSSLQRQAQPEDEAQCWHVKHMCTLCSVWDHFINARWGPWWAWVCRIPPEDVAIKTTCWIIMAEAAVQCSD